MKKQHHSIFLTTGFLSIVFLLVTSCKIQNTGDTQTGFSGKVVIVGAGASGLSAANALEEMGVDYQILEATDHYGGRIQKNDTFADFPIDLGAEWIHDDKSLLNKLTGKKGDEPNVETILYQPLNCYTWDGNNYEQIPVEELKEGYSSFKEYKFKRTTWHDYITENFAKHVERNIIYNSKVTIIDYSNDKVKLTTEKGKEYFADKVILTVPMGVLKSDMISFIPELPAEKREVMKSIEFAPGFKLFMKFSEKFYPDLIVSETYGEDSFFEETKEEDSYYEYYDAAYQKGANDNVLAFLSTGSLTKEYYQLGSEQAIVKAVLAKLDNIFDGAASKSYQGEYILQDWGRQPFTRGTWSDNMAGRAENKILNESLQDKVYFAGEAFSNEGGTVQSAIYSGYKAVEEAL